MNHNFFFTSLQSHFDKMLPWVAYRKPSDTMVKALLQEDDTLHRTTTFTESGFVFAPFDQSQEQSVLIPSYGSQTMTCDQSEETQEETSSTTTLKNIHSDDTPEARQKHIALVRKGVQEIKNGVLKKVVLSRKQTMEHGQRSPIKIFKKLLKEYPSAFVYCWYHPKIGLWLGATPETLLNIQNRQLTTMSLAGTQKATDISSVVWGVKEREEQQLVTDSIVQSLQSLVNTLKISEVQTHKAGSLLHLKTDVSARLDVSKVSLKEILEALHPTPAVCGLPRFAASRFISAEEGYNRRYYSGFLGELNLPKDTMRSRGTRNVENLAYRAVSKNSSLFVNLRCMELDASAAHLYVGGGITKASNPESEWLETVHKLQTMLKVL